jgi:hypothetical protein
MTSAAGDAFRGLLDSLRGVADWFDEQPMGELDRTEGYRHIAHLLACGLDHHLESDPDRPMFTRIVSPFRKIQGDNPDAVYQWTAIDGRKSYVIRGRNVGEVYLSFTVHGYEPDDPNRERVIADVNFESLVHDADGSYELMVSPDQPPEGYADNWLVGAPDARWLVTRHYFERPEPAAADPNLHLELAIEPVDDPGPAPSWTEELFAVRTAAVATFVHAKTQGMPSPEEQGPIPFVSREPNVLPPPFSFRDSGLDVPGAVDAHYSMGPFVLGADEALVLDGTITDCAFANVALWNRFMQTLEYRSHRTSLNRSQLELGPDGSYRVVVAHRDPGVANWLDTEGHEIGVVFWRFFLADESPGPIACRVVSVDEVASLG